MSVEDKETGLDVTIKLPNDVTFYLVRLADLIDLKNNIDRGIFPLEHYEGVSVLGDNYEKGLRWGVLHAIWGTRNMLANVGYGKEADVFLQLSHRQQEIQDGKT